MKRESIEKYEK